MFEETCKIYWRIVEWWFNGTDYYTERNIMFDSLLVNHIDERLWILWA